MGLSRFFTKVLRRVSTEGPEGSRLEGSTYRIVEGSEGMESL